MPDATVYVAEDEMDDYAPHVPRASLIAHPKASTLVECYNWMLTQFDEPCLIKADDDLVSVDIMRHDRLRANRDPEVIKRIIENAVESCEDLNLGVFCWSRNQNYVTSRTHEHPFRLMLPVMGTFGVMGKARYRKWDIAMHGRADFDFTLQTLLEDRIVLCDSRYYFNHGRVFTGEGGLRGKVTGDHFKIATELLVKKWGDCVGGGGTKAGRGRPKGKGSGMAKIGFALNVSRRNRSG
jgi:hypothetical protein